jgi:hypothetical protein
MRKRVRRKENRGEAGETTNGNTVGRVGRRRKADAGLDTVEVLDDGDNGRL